MSSMASRSLRWCYAAFPNATAPMRHISSVSEPSTFWTALAEKRLIVVTGHGTSGRASVAAAAAMALARQTRTLIVDADDPAHGMQDVIGIQFNEDVQDVHCVRRKLSSGKLPRASWTGAKLVGDDCKLAASQLSALGTREFLEHLLAADAWRQLIEDDSGANVLNSMGIPVKDLVGILECVRVPPGAEMPVALARLLQTKFVQEWDYVVVDAGAPALAAQLQSVPPVVANALQGLMSMQKLVKIARDKVMPSAVMAGLRVLTSNKTRTDWVCQYAEVLDGLEKLRVAMLGLSCMEKTLLLVLPYHAGKADQRAARRIIERLKPNCIALTGYEEKTAHLAPRPDWLPEGPEVVTLPWFEEQKWRKPTWKELGPLADSMLEAHL
eukprot:gnl/MRDRNA2_/MRDRNA2_36093_c0_seq1.p1 gnl/MRDRNA2_/MRDRNA2_36093_c0~~gnl/MRDRNA2_/MRDRNA2_36093_c0_seq1.p1  ORF type:complete len:383 (+),score=71.31 gnl/MRDRNA2_/MRDRNA2_36093_c0_seq1:108-1256(+)